jgi:CBS domain-containing protein
MASPAETLASDMTIGAAIDFFLGENAQHRAYPITDDSDRPIGLVSRADILTWIGSAASSDLSLASATAGRPLVTAWSGEMAITIAARMITKDSPRIPIIDDAGKLCGIISRADLLRVHHQVVAAETKRERFFLRRRDRRRAAAASQAPVMEDA